MFLNKNIKLKNKLKLKKIQNIYSRDLLITKDCVKRSFKVHQGNKFIMIKITDNMVGHKFGEFSPSRKRFSFKKK